MATRHVKRKRSQEKELELSLPASATPSQKRPRKSTPQSPIEDNIDEKVAISDSGEEINALEYWTKELRWPKEYSESDHLLASKEASSYLRGEQAEAGFAVSSSKCQRRLGHEDLRIMNGGQDTTQSPLTMNGSSYDPQQEAVDRESDDEYISANDTDDLINGSRSPGMSSNGFEESEAMTSYAGSLNSGITESADPYFQTYQVSNVAVAYGRPVLIMPNMPFDATSRRASIFEMLTQADADPQQRTEIDDELLDRRDSGHDSGHDSEHKPKVPDLVLPTEISKPSTPNVPKRPSLIFEPSESCSVWGLKVIREVSRISQDMSVPPIDPKFRYSGHSHLTRKRRTSKPKSTVIVLDIFDREVRLDGNDERGVDEVGVDEDGNHYVFGYAGHRIRLKPGQIQTDNTSKPFCVGQGNRAKINVVPDRLRNMALQYPRPRASDFLVIPNTEPAVNSKRKTMPRKPVPPAQTEPPIPPRDQKSIRRSQTIRARNPWAGIFTSLAAFSRSAKAYLVRKFRSKKKETSSSQLPLRSVTQKPSRNSLGRIELPLRPISRGISVSNIQTCLDAIRLREALESCERV